jgi:starch phosphorylase
MRESMAQLTVRFSAHRTVQDYTEQHYLPAAAAYRARSANKGEESKARAQWQADLDRAWPGLRFSSIQVETRDAWHQFEVAILLQDLPPTAVKVELFAEGIQGAEPRRQELKPLPRPAGPSGATVFAGAVPSDRPAGDYTARLMPAFPGLSIPLEDPRILWANETGRAPAC